MAWGQEVISSRRNGRVTSEEVSCLVDRVLFRARRHRPRATGAPPIKHLLVLAEEKGYRHEAVSHAAATIERLGRETGLWATTICTDTEALTKQKLEYNAKNLNDFDAVLFYTGGDLEMNAEQKAALLSFVHDDGKGFVGVHSATITFTSWPEYGEMIGGYFDEHPWGTFDAPILVEDANFPGMQQFPKSFVLKDEIYQIKDFSRDKVHVLMLELRRTILAYLPSDYIGFNQYWRAGAAPKQPEKNDGR